jgi:hypothetical protein
MAIDRACGFNRARPPRAKTVTLECPVCKKRKIVAKDKTDPENAARVVFACPDCADEVNIIDYFDADGRQIDCDGNPLK